MARVDGHAAALQDKLALEFGTNVTSGEIRIAFRDLDQLDDLCRRFCQPAKC
jgi:hypothetical protein